MANYGLLPLIIPRCWFIKKYLEQISPDTPVLVIGRAAGAAGHSPVEYS